MENVAVKYEASPLLRPSEAFAVLQEEAQKNIALNDEHAQTQEQTEQATEWFGIALPQAQSNDGNSLGLGLLLESGISMELIEQSNPCKVPHSPFLANRFCQCAGPGCACI